MFNKGIEVNDVLSCRGAAEVWLFACGWEMSWQGHALVYWAGLCGVECVCRCLWQIIEMVWVLYSWKRSWEEHVSGGTKSVSARTGTHLIFTRSSVKNSMTIVYLFKERSNILSTWPWTPLMIRLMLRSFLFQAPLFSQLFVFLHFPLICVTESA